MLKPIVGLVLVGITLLQLLLRLQSGNLSVERLSIALFAVGMLNFPLLVFLVKYPDWFIGEFFRKPELLKLVSRLMAFVFGGVLLFGLWISIYASESSGNYWPEICFLGGGFIGVPLMIIYARKLEK